MDASISMFAEGIAISAAQFWSVLAGAGSVIASLFWLLIKTKDHLIDAKDREFALLLAQKDAAIAETMEAKKSFERLAGETLKSAIDNANYYRERDGAPPVVMVAPVVPESNSPSTEKKREQARMETMLADLAALKLAAGQPPRPVPEHAIEKVKP